MNPFRKPAPPSATAEAETVIIRSAKWEGKGIRLEWVMGSGYVELTQPSPGSTSSSGDRTTRLSIIDLRALIVALGLADSEASQGFGT